MLAVALIASACSGGSSHGAHAGEPAHRASTTIGATTTGVTTPPTRRPGVKDLTQRYEPALPIAIQEAAAATAAGRLYVVGGYDTTENSSAAVNVFDGRSWQSAPSLPIAVNHPGAAAIGGSVYVAGGFTSAGATNRVFVLAAGATVWRELAPMSNARGALSLVAVHGRLIAIGGRDGTAQVSVTETYDPSTNTWTASSDMPAPRNHTAGYVDGTRACVAGGRTPETTAAIDCFDTATGIWHARAALPIATSGAASAELQQVTVVAGGEDSSESSINSVVQVLVGTARSTTSMLVPRHGTAFAVYRGRLWMCGGATSPGFHAVNTCTSLAV